MKYLNYIKDSCVDGYSWRNVLFLSGCTHNCDSCFSTVSQNPKNGEVVTPEFIEKVVEDLDKPHLDGITLSGGDPLHKRNVEGVISLCKQIREVLPDKTIWVYTGYTYEHLLDDPLRQEVLPLIDYLVDDRFEKGLHKKGLLYRGSSNQRIINTKLSLESSEIVLYKSGDYC